MSPDQNPFTVLLNSIKELTPKVAQEMNDLLPGQQRENMREFQGAMEKMQQRLTNPFGPVTPEAKQSSSTAADALAEAGGGSL